MRESGCRWTHGILAFKGTRHLCERKDQPQPRGPGGMEARSAGRRGGRFRLRPLDPTRMNRVSRLVSVSFAPKLRGAGAVERNDLENGCRESLFSRTPIIDLTSSQWIRKKESNEAPSPGVRALPFQCISIMLPRTCGECVRKVARDEGEVAPSAHVDRSGSGLPPLQTSGPLRKSD